MELKAGDEGTEIPLRACTTRATDGRDTSPQWQLEQQADTEDSDLSDIPEWIIEDNLHLNRNITPLAEQFIRDQGKRSDEDCGPAAVIGALLYLGSRADTRLRQILMKRLSYKEVRTYAAHHL